MNSGLTHKELKISLKVLAVLLCFIINGCGAIQLSLKPHVGPEISSTKNTSSEVESCDCEEKVTSCEECKIIPHSGSMRDLRYGYYYDPKEKKCKSISYSSGGIPAPFKTMEECKACCCKSW